MRFGENLGVNGHENTERELRTRVFFSQVDDT